MHPLRWACVALAALVMLAGCSTSSDAQFRSSAAPESTVGPLSDQTLASALKSQELNGEPPMVLSGDLVNYGLGPYAMHADQAVSNQVFPAECGVLMDFLSSASADSRVAMAAWQSVLVLVRSLPVDTAADNTAIRQDAADQCTTIDFEATPYQAAYTADVWFESPSIPAAQDVLLVTIGSTADDELLWLTFRVRGSLVVMLTDPAHESEQLQLAGQLAAALWGQR